MSDISPEDLALNTYEGIRMDLAKKLSSKKNITDDVERANLLVKIIDGGSRTALASKRLKADQEATASQQQKMDLFATLLMNTPTASQRRAMGGRDPLPDVDIVVPEKGETDIGTKALSFEEMMGKEPKS